MIKLIGEKVYLKPMEEADITNRVRWINDPDIQDTLNYVTPVSLARTKKWFNKMIDDFTRYEFSIYSVETDEQIGFCGLFNIEKPEMKAESHAVIGEKKYWKGGFGTETLKILMEYGFKELGLNRIYGYQRIHNNSSHRMVEKLGWKREGLLRQNKFSHGKLHDVYIVSILREDYNSL
jgi:RimJ/RimL family protein N-acetyltransferase